MSTHQYNYSFFRIPKDNTLVSSAQKYKKLRLHALSVSSTSFSSRYEIESALSEEDWVGRLASTDTETFICATTPLHTNLIDPCAPEESTWVGQVTLRGPLSTAAFTFPEVSGQKQLAGDEDQELWQMLSLFMLPEHRGQGLGKRLCEEALGYLRWYQTSPPEIWVRLMVKPQNYATVHLYRGLGFVDAGKCTLVEALIANGDQDLLPDDISGQRYTSRSGLIMMLEMRRS